MMSIPPIFPKAEVFYGDLEEKTKHLRFHPITDFDFDCHFNDVLCHQDTAVKIGFKYVHANHIPMPDGTTYIAAQAPDDISLFWKTAAQFNSLVVDLTTFPEAFHSSFPLAYYPMPRTSEDYKDVHVEWITGGWLEADKVMLSDYKVTAANITKTVQRLHFMHWMDKEDAPLASLERLIDEIDKRTTPGSEPIIHCKGGIGRSGTLITSLTLKHLFKQDPVAFQKDPVGMIESVIMQGRQSRGPQFVQNTKQLEMIMNYVKLLLNFQG